MRKLLIVWLMLISNKVSAGIDIIEQDDSEASGISAGIIFFILMYGLTKIYEYKINPYYDFTETRPGITVVILIIATVIINKILF